MFADIEAAIVARLRERLPDSVHVDTLDELERVPEMRQRAPAVWVIYDGYAIGSRIGNQVAQVRQSWYTVIATKSARGSGKVAVAKGEASELCRLVIEALLGFHLGGGKYLQIEEAPGPEYDAGYCHAPLAFSNAATFKGVP